MDKISFSAYTKNELSKMSNLKNKQEVYFEFLGYCSSANLVEGAKSFKFSTENEYNINRFAKLLNNININDYKIEIQGKTYIITAKENLQNFNITEEIASSENLKRAYIRGSFLGGGYINNPENKYHLEVVFRNKTYVDSVAQILSEYDIKYGLLDKGKNTILYIKDSDEISKFLALIGANSAVLKFEETRVMRDMKNNINRLVNCETANLNKTINAAVEQMTVIKKLKKTKKFETLPEDLKELATLREKYPNATLTELGKKMTKPIGKTSVSNKFKKLKDY